MRPSNGATCRELYLASLGHAYTDEGDARKDLVTADCIMLACKTRTQTMMLQFTCKNAVLTKLCSQITNG
jgi:hypothetical protein